MTALDPYGQKLPGRTEASDALCIRCPWCSDQIDDLAVPIEALQHAHEIDVLTGRGNWLFEGRVFDGAACECPRCARPLLVKFVTDRLELASQSRSLVIAPMRTRADCRYLAEKMGLF